MRISEKRFQGLPPNLRTLFQKVPNHGSEEVLGCFPNAPTGSLTGQPRVENKIYGSAANTIGRPRFHAGDKGSAARFFYTAKASRSERGKGNNHPTVKPRALIRYLLKLITGPGDNLILDMFAGSGTVPLECERAGVKWVAIEKEQASCEIIKSRIETYEWGETEPDQERLFPTQEALF